LGGSLITFFAQAKDYNYLGIKPAVIVNLRTVEEFASGHIEDMCL
jgi:hypothetical protein